MQVFRCRSGRVNEGNCGVRERMPRAYFNGIKAIEVCTEKGQEQPDAPSGMSNNPPTGIILIAQPGRVIVDTILLEFLFR